jgi:hypothetical protein
MAFPGAEVSESVAEGYETRPYQITIQRRNPVLRCIDRAAFSPGAFYGLLSFIRIMSHL